MKRFISCCLIIALLCNAVILADAAETDSSSPNYSLFLQSYVGSDDDTYLRTNANFGYWRFIEDYESDIVATEILNSIDVLIGCGTQPSVQKYTEVLVNIIATYDHDNASDVSEQRKNDNMKSALDYAMDITKIGADAVGLMTDMSKSTSDLEEWIVKAISGLSTMKGNIDNWIDALSDLETLIQNYSKYDLFLELIEKNAKGDLRTAAASLRTSMEKAMQLKLDTYNSILNENFNNYTEFFFNDLFFDTLKLTSEYDNDDNFKTLVDCGSEFADKVKEFINFKKAWDLGLSIGTLVGNVAVGGEDLINRLHELMALRDIGNILCSALEEDEALYTLGKYDETVGEHFFVLSEYLTGCRLRGEYCLYSIVAADAGLLSKFSIEKANDAYNWYTQRSSLIIGIMHAMDSACDALLVPITDINYEVGEVSEWYIYDESGNLCCNYTLRITSKEIMHIGAIETDFIGPIEYPVTKPEPLSLELEAGYWYGVEIVDNINNDNSLFFTVFVNDSSDGLIEMIEIETDFTAAYENSLSNEKKLTAITTYQDNRKSEEYHFSYNDKGLLTSTVQKYDSYSITVTYIYDSDSRLVERWSSAWGGAGPSIKYHYDSNGYLVEISGLGEGGGIGDVYVNDPQGRPVSSYSTTGLGSSVSEYEYSDDGRTVTEVITSTDYYGDASVAHVNYTYDAEGRLISVNEALPDRSYQRVYSYDNKPFIAKADPGKLPDCYSICDIMGHEIWSLHTDVPESIETDGDGYVTRISVVDRSNFRENITYEFFYEELSNEEAQPTSNSSTEDQSWAKAYIPKIEQALKTAAEADMPGAGIGILYDLDDDNVPELILSYPWWQGQQQNHIPVYAYDIYDYENNQLVCYAERQTIHAAYVAGSEGYIGIELYKNEPTLMTYYRWGETGAWDGYDNAEYGISVFNSDDFSPARVLWVDAEQYSATYKIDGITVSEEEFIEEASHFSCLSMFEFSHSPVYFRPQNKYGEDLHDLLSQLQTLVGIESPYSTELTKR